MDKIEKIRQFVKELQQDFISIQPKDCSLELIKSYAGYAYLDKVLSFLDTLSEESDKSLEEAAYKYSFDSRPSIYGQVDVIDAFIAGAEWQKAQLPTDKEMISLFRLEYEKGIADTIAKYEQKSQMPMPEDTVLFNNGVAEGRRLEREDMMKDAVEGYVNYYEDSGGILMAEAQVGCPYHNGDKVRIIVLKEEE